MNSDYIPRLRHELLRAAASKHARWRWARGTRGLRPLGAAAAVALLAVAVVLAVPGGHRNERSIESTAGTLHLTYRVEPAGAGATERTAQVVRDRLAAAGIHDAGVSAAPSGRLTIAASPSARADVAALLRSGRFAIYDWERSVLGPRGVPAAADAGVTGGTDAGRGAAITKAEAESRAAGRPGGRAVHALDNAPDGWFALGGEPALTNADIARAHAAVDPTSDEPIVAIELTSRGENAFTALTRSLARHGSTRAADGVGDDEARQHFAMVVDDRIVAVPFIDFRQAPHGIDGARGAQIQGGLTPRTARQLAALLSAGPLAASPALESERTADG